MQAYKVELKTGERVETMTAKTKQEAEQHEHCSCKPEAQTLCSACTRRLVAIIFPHLSTGQKENRQ